LFNRQVRVFPPPGLDAGANFFARELPASDQAPGRLYVGVCAPGRRLKAALIRVYVATLAAGQTLYEKYGEIADPFMTAVGYFSSLRELGGMRRLVDDDVRSRLTQVDARGLKRRNLRLPQAVEELTSRKSAVEIPEVLERMKTKFPPPGQQPTKTPIDVLLATNMLSVGVDVGRLGVMIVAGQPKSTSEYIQATSRVGRATPGIVMTVSNWARPRDLSHFESFCHYHATFYRQVEALSVTPYSVGAMDKMLLTTTQILALSRCNPRMRWCRPFLLNCLFELRKLEQVAQRFKISCGRHSSNGSMIGETGLCACEEAQGWGTKTGVMV